MPKVKETPIDGLLIFKLDVNEDERGWFKENYQKEKLVELGLPQDFEPVQNNISYNTDKGVTRGIHAEPWNKYITLGKGAVLGAWVDLRKDSSTYKQVVTQELDHTDAVYVPKGVGNSFQALTKDVVYTYLVDAHWSPEAQYDLVNLGDPSLNINWPINLGEAIMSDKDKNHPTVESWENA